MILTILFDRNNSIYTVPAPGAGIEHAGLVPLHFGGCGTAFGTITTTIAAV